MDTQSIKIKISEEYDMREFLGQNSGHSYWTYTGIPSYYFMDEAEMTREIEINVPDGDIGTLWTKHIPHEALLLRNLGKAADLLLYYLATGADRKIIRKMRNQEFGVRIEQGIQIVEDGILENGDNIGTAPFYRYSETQIRLLLTKPIVSSPFRFKAFPLRLVNHGYKYAPSISTDLMAESLNKYPPPLGLANISVLDNYEPSRNEIF